MNRDVMSTVFIAADMKTTTVLTDVKASLRRALGNFSPGPDSMPLCLYRRNSGILYPLLARLFTAIMAVI